MKSLIFYTKEVSLRDLKYSNLKKICNHKNRYNCITDLTLKGANQIHIFINRINELYQNPSGKSKYKRTSKFKKSKIETYLKIVFCKEKSEPESLGFPLYEFLKFNIIEDRKISASGLGVMLSSYIHDFDREKIENQNFAQNNITLSILFWKSLFERTSLNAGFPPLEGQKPVFIFPHQKQSDSIRSSTNDYMNYLGLEMDIGYTVDNNPLRMFYKSTHPKLDDLDLYFGFIAIGQVCLEMTRPDLYCGNSELLPFDRNNFTQEVKLQQKSIFLEWLMHHKEFFERSEFRH